MLYTGGAPRTTLQISRAITGDTHDSAIRNGQLNVFFVFQSPASESALLDIADNAVGVLITTANVEALAEHGVMGEAWTLPPNPLHKPLITVVTQDL